MIQGRLRRTRPPAAYIQCRFAVQDVGSRSSVTMKTLLRTGQKAVFTVSFPDEFLRGNVDRFTVKREMNIRKRKCGQVNLPSLEEFGRIGLPASGTLLARLPAARQVLQWLNRAFVPFTAAGQRGLSTPLPHIHPCLEPTCHRPFSFIYRRP